MNVKQFTASKTTSLTQMLAVGTLAIGASVGIAAAPAHAVSLNNGQVVWTGTTTGFLEQATGLPGSTISVVFNQLPAISLSPINASVSSASTPFSPTFFNQNAGGVTGAGFYAIAPVTAVFNYSGGTAAGYFYTLAANINFAFGNGVTLTVAGGTVFTGSNSGSGANLNTNNFAGSFFTESGVVTNTNALSFGLNDIGSGASGTYGILASTIPPTSKTAVPEPFTIVGTILGGAAALRMRKKMSDAN